MAAGLIPVSAEADRWTLQANAPRWREVAESRDAVAAMLGLEPRDIGERPLWASTGREQLIIPLTSEEAVRRARPQSGPLSRFVSADGANMAYVFAPRRAAGSANSSPPAGGQVGREFLLARFFFPQGPRCWRIRRQAPQQPISADGASRWAASAPVGSRSHRASRPSGRRFSIWTWMRTSGCASAVVWLSPDAELSRSEPRYA